MCLYDIKDVMIILKVYLQESSTTSTAETKKWTEPTRTWTLGHQRLLLSATMKALAEYLCLKP